MGRLNDNEVKEVARMQKLIDTYELMVNNLHRATANGEYVEFVYRGDDNLGKQFADIFKWVKEHKQQTKCVWHSWREKPSSGRILYTYTDENFPNIYVGYYNAHTDRFTPDEGCGHSGAWRYIPIKQWAYLNDFMPKE